jgi:putative transposase
MPRRPRLTLPNVPLHIIQRGNNRQACFFADDDYRIYLEWLGEYATKHACHIHAYVLMTNHVHLLLSSPHSDAPGKLMKALGQRYVQYVNRVYQRSGTLWEGRFRSCLTEDDAYLLTCQRYIELNPIRANMVQHPADYPWSSYRVNAGIVSPHGDRPRFYQITPHPLYMALGHDIPTRQAAYRELFRYSLEPQQVDNIRHATNGNFVLGSGYFAEQIEANLQRRVTPGKAGRPTTV